MQEDVIFMQEAMNEARLAASRGNIPVGAVLVKDGKIISKAANTQDAADNPFHHAEMSVIADGIKKLTRLDGASLYVTLEPCLMCAGAALNARVARIIWAASDPKAGACGSLYDVINDARLHGNRTIECISGIMALEAQRLLSDFFIIKRNKIAPVGAPLAAPAVLSK